MEQKRLVSLSISKRHSAVGLHPPSVTHLASKQGVRHSCQLTIFYYHLTFRNTNYRKEVQSPGASMPMSRPQSEFKWEPEHVICFVMWFVVTPHSLADFRYTVTSFSDFGSSMDCPILCNNNISIFRDWTELLWESDFSLFFFFLFWLKKKKGSEAVNAQK